VLFNRSLDVIVEDPREPCWQCCFVLFHQEEANLKEVVNAVSTGREKPIVRVDARDMYVQCGLGPRKQFYNRNQPTALSEAHINKWDCPLKGFGKNLRSGNLRQLSTTDSLCSSLSSRTHPLKITPELVLYGEVDAMATEACYFESAQRRSPLCLGRSAKRNLATVL